jgi:hypothetical protein
MCPKIILKSWKYYHMVHNPLRIIWDLPDFIQGGAQFLEGILWGIVENIAEP